MAKMFPVYTDRSQNPEVWDGVAGALTKAGVPNTIAAIRIRQTAVWTAHVDLKPIDHQPPPRVIVSRDLNTWKVLCLESGPKACAKFGL